MQRDEEKREEERKKKDLERVRSILFVGMVSERILGLHLEWLDWYWNVVWDCPDYLAGNCQ